MRAIRTFAVHEVLRPVPRTPIRCSPTPSSVARPGRRGSARRASRPVTVGVAVAAFAALIAVRGEGPDAAAASGDDTIPSVAVLVPDDRLDPRIVAMDLQGATWTRAVGALDDALFDAADNQRRLALAARTLEELRTQDAAVAAARTAAAAERRALAAELAAVEAVLRARALERYVHFGDDTLVGLDDPSRSTDAARSVALGHRVDEIQFSTRDELLERQAHLEQETRDLAARAVELGAELESTETVIAERLDRIAVLTGEVERATEGVRAARRSAVIPGIDISVVALDAYLTAEALLAADNPSCGVRWWMIAGVARIESIHGRFGGRTLQADGRVDRPIIGIALDGGPGVRAMIDTDDGVYDGDPVWDRAVGPLQFIPETWSRRARDANGDGRLDPQNIYDASYTAGRYLCALGGDLGSRSALRAAYFGYNTSSVYVADVLAHADRYAAFDLPAPAETVASG